MDYDDKNRKIRKNPPGGWKRERERMDSERVTKPWQVCIQLPLQT